MTTLISGCQTAYSPLSSAANLSHEDSTQTSIQDSSDRKRPLAPETKITKEIWLLPENIQWALRNAREIVPTAAILNSPSPAALSVGTLIQDEKLVLKVHDGQPVGMAQYLSENHVDGLLIMHGGKIVYERYFNGMQARDVHSWASMAKSMVGLITMQLAQQQKIDLNAPLASYVPQLRDSPFGQATVQQNMDMQVALKYPPTLPPDIGMFIAAGLLPARNGMPDSIRSFLKIPQALARPEGGIFYYQNGSTEAVAWALERVTGRSLSDLVREMVWEPMGAQDQAYYPLDSAGVEFASGGLHSTLRDAARFGELIRNQGRVQGRQVVAAQAMQRILATPSAANQALVAQSGRATSSGTGYASFWWHPIQASGAVIASGRFGQRILVDPANALTIVQFGTYPDTRARPVTAGQAISRQEHALRTDDGLVALARAALRQLKPSR